MDLARKMWSACMRMGRHDHLRHGKPVGEVQDDHFSSGRVGVFVRSASPDVYTYRMTISLLES